MTMGPSAAAERTFNDVGTDVDDFFPHGVKIHVGDKVKFIPGFHTVQFTTKGTDPLALFVTDGTRISGVNDAAGQPFWFNGQDELNLNPALVTTSLFGKHVTFNPKKGLESGLPLGPSAKPFTVRFKTAGNFTYFCNVHIGMKGTVTVLKKGKRIPTATADRTALKKQVTRDLKVAKKLPAAHVPAGTVDVGNAGPHGVEFYGMLPSAVTVPVGTTVNFRMAVGSVEDHTATFGPGDPENDPNSYLGQLAASFNSPVVDQGAVYPSEAPGTPATLTPLLHGNGFWNTGVMDTATSTPLQSSNSVTFGAPGMYNYYCMIHPFMHGVINVQ